MVAQEKKWEKIWGDLNWKKVKSSDIDTHVSKGVCVDMVEKITYPWGYEHTNPILESLKADNPVAFAHLIQKGANVNFHWPYVNLYPDGPRRGKHSIMTDSPNLLYIRYAIQKGMKVLPSDFQDVIHHKGARTEDKLALIADYFEKRKNSKECLELLKFLPQVENKNFVARHQSALLAHVDLKDVQELPEKLQTDRIFKNRMLQLVRNRSNGGINPQVIARTQKSNG